MNIFWWAGWAWLSFSVTSMMISYQTRGFVWWFDVPIFMMWGGTITLQALTYQNYKNMKKSIKEFNEMMRKHAEESNERWRKAHGKE